MLLFRQMFRRNNPANRSCHATKTENHSPSIHRIVSSILMHVCDRLAAHLHPSWPSAQPGTYTYNELPVWVCCYDFACDKEKRFFVIGLHFPKRLREGVFRETCCALIRCAMYSILHETGGHLYGHYLQVRLTHGELSSLLPA